MLPPWFAPQHSWSSPGSAATLPTSAFAAYDPATAGNRVLGAVSFNGSTQYASTTSPPVTELGNGTAVVVGLRLSTSSTRGSETALGFGAGGNNPNFTIERANLDGRIYVRRNDGSTVSSALGTSSQNGWVSLVVKLAGDGTARIAVLLPGARSVTWVDSATTKVITGLVRLRIGAGGNPTVGGFWGDSICDVYVGTSATAITDAAMEAFCLGADPASAEVDAANHWPLQTDYDDAIGSADLTATGSPTMAEDGADVVVNRDITADSAHANYQANVVGGFQFGGSNYLSSASWSRPSGDYYVAIWLYMPDTSPAAFSRLWSEYVDSNNNREIYVNSTSVTVVDRIGGSSRAATITGKLVAGWQLVVAKYESDGAARTCWQGPVGGALSTATEGTTATPAASGTLYLGSSNGGSVVEANTAMAKTRVFHASDVADETKFLRSLLRNWSQDVPTPVHQWNGVSDANDTGSGTTTNLTWSASAAYDDGLVVSSHYHELPPTGVTWSEANSAPDYNGSTGYGRISNAPPLSHLEVFSGAMRIIPDDVSGLETIFCTSDAAASSNTVLVYKNNANARLQCGNQTVDTTGDALAAGVACTVHFAQSAANARTISVNDDTATSSGTNTATGSETVASFGRREDGTPDRYLAAILTRRVLCSEPDDQAAARAWAEDAAA